MSPLKPHHAAWLADHPHRTEAWLRGKLADRFDIHHIDGNHHNNNPRNLVLIESMDHSRLHGGNSLRPLFRQGPEKTKGIPKRSVKVGEGKYLRLLVGERKSSALKTYEEFSHMMQHRIVYAPTVEKDP